MIDVFYNFGIQVLFTLGLILIFGLLIRLCNVWFYRNMGSFGRTACYVTGFIGTPVHECAHALMCIIFGHKITDMKLFQISSSDGTLGYVEHSYNRKNLYHRIGNFFIGVAPILVISAVLYFLASYLVPDMLREVTRAVSLINTESGIAEVLVQLVNAVLIFFSYFAVGEWWIFVILGSFLALHMTLSPADIKNAKGGLILLLLLLLGVDAFLYFFGLHTALGAVTTACITIGSYLTTFLVMGLIVSLFAVLVSIIIRKLLRR